MKHKGIPNSVLAERYFPVRLRAAVPQNGFGSHVNEMHRWATENCGRGNFFDYSGGRYETFDATYFYFIDLDAAHAFVTRFASVVRLPVSGERDRINSW